MGNGSTTKRYIFQINVSPFFSLLSSSDDRPGLSFQRLPEHPRSSRIMNRIAIHKLKASHTYAHACTRAQENRCERCRGYNDDGLRTVKKVLDH